jgi:hypothetical protein
MSTALSLRTAIGTPTSAAVGYRIRLSDKIVHAQSEMTLQRRKI